MCLACNDIGLLCSAPEGEIIYCEACVKGLTKALRKLGAQLEVDQAWLARKQAEGLSSEWAEALFGLEL